MKRWSYATAIMLSLAGGTIMTGCIDNDEPYGIEQIRLATADFLKSQKALAEANAEAAKAKAEVDKINAEIAKIQAEIEKAKAESEIKIAEAEAAAKLAQTQAEAEEAQAKADLMKAKVQTYIDGMKAQIDRYIAETENAIALANLAYEKALHQWELDKIENAEAASNALYQKVADAYDLYLHKLEAFNALNQELVEAQRNSAQWMNNLVYEDGQWIHPQDKLKDILNNEIDGLQKNIASQEEIIAGYNEKIAELEAVTSGNEMYQLYQKYQGELKDLRAQYAEANVKFEEEVLKNEPLKQEVDQLQASWQEEGNKEIAIAPYKYEPNNAALPGYLTSPWEIVEGTSYTLNNDYNYLANVNRYEAFLENLKRALLDENDIEWTSARLAELNRVLASQEASFVPVKAAWTAAKKVYNKGGKPDVSGLAKETELEKAISDYEAAGAALTPLYDAYASAQKAETAARTANDEAMTAYNTELDKYNMSVAPGVQAFYDANEAYWKAMDAAEAAENATKTAAQAAENAANQTAWNNYEIVWNNYDVARKNLAAAQAELALDPKNESLIEAVTTAQTKYDAAKLNFDGKPAEGNTPAIPSAWDKYQESCSANATARQNAEKKAEVARQKAEAAANETYKTAYNKFLADGGYDQPKDNTAVAAAAAAAEKAVADLDKAMEATQTAYEAIEKPAQALEDAYYAIGTVINEQESAIDFPWSKYQYYNAWYGMNDFKNGVEGAELPTIIPPVLYISGNQVYSNAKNYLIAKSKAAYGSFTYDWQTGNPGFDSDDIINDEAFLLDDVTAETLNKYIEKQNPNIPPYLYGEYGYYNQFGAFGALLNTQDEVQIATAYLNNNNLYNQLTATAQANLDKLVADNTAAKDAQTAAEEAYEAKKAEFESKFDAIIAEKQAIDKKITMIQEIINAINNNFSDVNDVNAWTPTSLDNMLKAVKANVVSAEKVLASYQTSLETAQNNLVLLENGKADYTFNPYTATIEDLTSRIAVAKEGLDLCKTHLDELQAKYEAASKL